MSSFLLSSATCYGQSYTVDTATEMNDYEAPVISVGSIQQATPQSHTREPTAPFTPTDVTPFAYCKPGLTATTEDDRMDVEMDVAALLSSMKTGGACGAGLEPHSCSSVRGPVPCRKSTQTSSLSPAAKQVSAATNTDQRTAVSANKRRARPAASTNRGVVSGVSPNTGDSATTASATTSAGVAVKSQRVRAEGNATQASTSTSTSSSAASSPSRPRRNTGSLIIQDALAKERSLELSRMSSSGSTSSACSSGSSSTGGGNVEGALPVSTDASSGAKGSKVGGTSSSSSSNNRRMGQKWSAHEDEQLRAAVASLGPCNWEHIAQVHLQGSRSSTQCLHRWQQILRPGLKKGSWTKDEDDIIIKCRESGMLKWADIAQHLPGRLGKQCRDRWINHLSPDVKKDAWTEDEDRTLLQAQKDFGNAWTKIAQLLPGRSENSIKNRFYSARRSHLRVTVPAPAWDLKAEKQVLTDYCAGFGEGDDLDMFLPTVLPQLRMHEPMAYASDMPSINRTKLHRRLWGSLKRMAAKHPSAAAIRRATGMRDAQKHALQANISSGRGGEEAVGVDVCAPHSPALSSEGSTDGESSVGKKAGSHDSGTTSTHKRKRALSCDDNDNDTGAAVRALTSLASSTDVARMFMPPRQRSSS